MPAHRFPDAPHPTVEKAMTAIGLVLNG